MDLMSDSLVLGILVVIVLVSILAKGKRYGDTPGTLLYANKNFDKQQTQTVYNVTLRLPKGKEKTFDCVADVYGRAHSRLGLVGAAARFSSGADTERHGNLF